MAHLVCPILEWADSAADEGPEEVVSGQPLFLELEESGVKLLDGAQVVVRLVLPVVLLGGGPILNFGRRIRSTFGSRFFT